MEAYFGCCPGAVQLGRHSIIAFGSGSKKNATDCVIANASLKVRGAARTASEQANMSVKRAAGTPWMRLRTDRAKQRPGSPDNGDGTMLAKK